MRMIPRQYLSYGGPISRVRRKGLELAVNPSRVERDRAADDCMYIKALNDWNPQIQNSGTILSFFTFHGPKFIYFSRGSP